MGMGIKIIVADDNRNLCQILQNYFQGQKDLNLVGVAYDGLEAWELIQTQEPDLIMLDLVMPNLDGLGVVEKIYARTTMTRPKIIMLSAFGQESLTNQAMIRGVDHFILKPFDLDNLNKRIRFLTQDMPASSIPTQFASASPIVTTVEYNIYLLGELTKLLHRIGVPAHIKGYQYLRDAILMVEEDVSLLRSVTKKLYPSIAKKNETIPRSVDSGIRHAIELALVRGHEDTLKRIFGYSMNIEHHKPTNAEFIARLTEELRAISKVS